MPILHVVGEHHFDFGQIELPSSAKLEDEVVLVPWGRRHLVGLDPGLQLVKHLLLVLAHVADVPKPDNSSVIYSPFARLFSFLLFAQHLFIIINLWNLSKL